MERSISSIYDWLKTRTAATITSGRLGRRRRRQTRRLRANRARPLRFESCEDRLLLATMVLNPVKDANLIEFPVDNSNGAGNWLTPGRVHLNQGNTIRRGVLAFDLSSLPAGATVTDARLELHVSRDRGGAQSNTLHKLHADWGEGTSLGGGRGQPATPGSATWRHRFFPDVLWTSAGGDFESTPSATAVTTARDTWTTWSSAQTVADVQSWLDDPSTNFGWLIRGNESTGTTVTRFVAKDSARFPNPPRLVVTYDCAEIGDASIVEGDSGTTDAVVNVSLSRPFASTVQVDFATADGQGIQAATAPSDYVATSGTLTFAPGVVSQPITVQVKGDTEVELDEHFFVNLSNISGAALGDSQGQINIANTDGAHINWTGAADGTSWGNAGNWDLNRVPDLTDDIVIIPEVAATPLINVVGNRTVNRIISDETLRIYGGTLTLSTATSFANRVEIGRSGFGAGNLAIESEGFSVGELHQIGNVSGSGDLEVDGDYNWEFGQTTGSGTTFANGGLTLSGEINKDLSGRRLVTAGTSTLTGGGGTGTFRIGNGGVLHNMGTFEIRSQVHINSLGGGGEIINEGLFTKVGTSGAATSRINTSFTNNGTVAVQTSTLNFGDNLTNFDAASGRLTGGTYRVTSSMLLGGNITTNAAAIELVAAAANIRNSITFTDALAQLASNRAIGSLTVTNGHNLTLPAFSNAGQVTVGAGTVLMVNGDYTQTEGSTKLDATGSLQPTGQVHIQGGALTGTGTIAADVSNSGLIEPGDPGGTLTISGDLTQSATGSLNFELGQIPSLVPQPNFDQLSVTGAASLGGTLRVEPSAGFVSSPGDEFRLMSFASHTGSFAIENLNAGGNQIASTVLEPARLIVRVLAPAATVSAAMLNDGRPNRSGLDNLALQFSDPVTLAEATALQFFNHTSGAPVDISAAALSGNGSTLLKWNLANVTWPLGDYTATLPASVAGLAATYSTRFHILPGDSNGNRRVEFGDFGQLAANFNTLGGPVYGPGDMNGDGDVTFGDFGILASNFNRVLAAPALDFGDAGGSFATLLPSGARHWLGSGPILGDTADAEPDGQPNADASGDGADEDGVTFGTLQVGSNAALTVIATIPATAFLNAWIDFNANGSWDDAGEQILVDRAVVDGTNNLTFAVPASAATTQVFSRFRISSVPGYAHTGLARDGEVEDYLVTIVSPFLEKVPGVVGGERARLGR